METQLQLAEIETFLMGESQRRIIDKVNELSIFDCLTETINSLLGTLELYYPDDIRRRVCDLLSKHSKQFQTVMLLLVEHFSEQDLSNDEIENQIQKFYESVILDCRKGKNLPQYANLCLYAAATCMNTGIYVVCRNEFGRSRWSYFPPLFTYEGQPENVLEYITMAMTSEKKFYKVTSDNTFPRVPNATGVVGMYLEALQDISPLNIEVPGELLALPNFQRLELCDSISSEILRQSCELFLQRQLIRKDEYDILIYHAGQRGGFCRLVSNSRDAFQIVCQVLIYRRDKDVLTKCVSDWTSFVSSCDFLRMFHSLAVLDKVLCKKNLCVSEFVESCQQGGRELDERRSTVTTAVIASSSVSIASTGIVIAGLLFAPLTFGASVGLSIAGGVVGVGAGAIAGGAKIYEADKQKTKLNDIQAEQAKIQETEQAVVIALENTQLLFRRHIAGTENGMELGIIGSILQVAGALLKASSSIGIAATKLAAGAAGAAGVARCSAGAAGVARCSAGAAGVARCSAGAAGVARCSAGAAGVARCSAGAAGVARCSAGAAKASAAVPVLGPLSIAVDVLFLAQAANSKARGDRTDAGEMLQSIAETINTKSIVLNSLLRGNLQQSVRNNSLHPLT